MMMDIAVPTQPVSGWPGIWLLNGASWLQGAVLRVMGLPTALRRTMLRRAAPVIGFCTSGAALISLSKLFISHCMAGGESRRIV